MSAHDVANIIELSCHEVEPLDPDSSATAAPNSPVSDNTTPYWAEVLADHIANTYDQKLLKNCLKHRISLKGVMRRITLCL